MFALWREDPNCVPSDAWQYELAKVIKERTGKNVDPRTIYPHSMVECKTDADKNILSFKIAFTYKEEL